MDKRSGNLLIFSSVLVHITENTIVLLKKLLNNPKKDNI
jgi:hypothetical protein